nr:hypothetical protein Itr_chr04CG08230 [Ipomoea trifida]
MFTKALAPRHRSWGREESVKTKTDLDFSRSWGPYVYESTRPKTPILGKRRIGENISRSWGPYVYESTRPKTPILGKRRIGENKDLTFTKALATSILGKRRIGENKDRLGFFVFVEGVYIINNFHQEFSYRLEP